MRSISGSTLAISLTALSISILMLLFPQEGITSALRGIAIWWDILFPALFPFFVVSELLIGFGIVHCIGTLFDPMMRPLFRVPGIGGFIMAMGFASGYPVGARLTSQLWEKKLITRFEGERLVAFTTSSDPIFLIGAVCIGFFHNPGLAGILALSHYGASVLVGFIMRYHGTLEPNHIQSSKKPNSSSILLRSFHAMHQARIEDGRTLGELLQQAIQSSLRLTFVVGGLVVFFAVVIELLTLSGIMNVLYILVESVLHALKIPTQLSASVVNGLFEVTLGAKSAGSAGDQVPLLYKVAIASFVLSWAGLSVHAQIISLVQHTGMRYGPFIFARFLHGVLSAVLVFLFWKPMKPINTWIGEAIPVFYEHSEPLSYWSAGLLLPVSFLAIILLFIPVLYLIHHTLHIILKIWRRLSYKI